MSSPNRRSRSTFMKSAELHHLSRRQQFMRLQFRQRQPSTSQPAANDPDAIFTAASVFADPAKKFEPTSEGSGIFGEWTVDEIGLPAYNYTFDQYRDPRALFPNSEKLDRRDHWHQIGNQRVTALGSNDGTVQVYLGDRGGVFLNKFEAWQSERNVGVLSVLLSGIIRVVMVIIQLVARFASKKSTETAQPFAAQSAAVQSIQPKATENPRNTLPIQRLQELQEDVNDPLLKSYNLLSGQDEPVVKAASAPTKPAGRDHHVTAYAFSGGFGYIDDGEQVWATAFRYRPSGAEAKRRFGMGYMETELTHRGIKAKRRVYAPQGDYPFLLADVTLENTGSKPVTLKHYEYWDVNVQQLRLEWLRGSPFGAANDMDRRAIGKQFQNSINYRADEATLEFRQDPPPDAPPADQPSPIDWYPAPIFLTDLDGETQGHYINKASFFGAGGALQPDVVRLRQEDGALQAGSIYEPMPYCMVLRRDITLQPGEAKMLRYAYGAAFPEARRSMLGELTQIDDPFEDTLEKWQEQLIYFKTDDDPVLHREMAWHSYNLLSASVYNAYHNVNLIPQGSAYLYLHGADGAPRDQALFSLPMIYLRPELARDMLRLMMRLTDGASGQIPYSFCGHGYTSNGLNIHTNPSDLDLFFLLAMSEYLGATRNYAFLNESIPFYPPDKPGRATGTTVLDHIRFALKHLFDRVGLGENGLIRVRTGDWSDSIVLETALKDGLLGVAYQNSKAHGESVPNTQMALYVLPLVASLLKDVAPDITAMLRDGRLERMQEAVEKQWNAKGWYNRAVLRGVSNQPVMLETLSLESQVWGLISGSAKKANHEANLVERVEATLDRPSPIGAALSEGGMVWPAISQLLTWGYVRAGRAGLAWRSLNRNTFATHAQQYPAIWFGIWGAPDGINGTWDALPGGTWSSPMTPMTDFPTMNANADAMALLGLVRVCGIEPSADGQGLVIRPQVPRERFVLDTPLIRLEVNGKTVKGEYRAHFGGSMNLYIYTPGATAPVVIPAAFYAGDRVPFEVKG
ncbi:MAG: hypothetical protein LCI00_19785 [Chloroflexi bacterium]|nr:hypothetical protein [Chloroflexota bacterium]MCC6891358.1 hypothetical protein [Anaerolineae bacterium]